MSVWQGMVGVDSKETNSMAKDPEQRAVMSARLDGLGGTRRVMRLFAVAAHHCGLVANQLANAHQGKSLPLGFRNSASDRRTTVFNVNA